MTTYAETIAQSTVDLMERDEKVLVMGVGVTDHRGIFGTTKLARERFPDRVIETPLSETMLTGSLVGLAQDGWHPILVHARADFMTLSAEHLINTVAKWQYMNPGSKPLQIMVRCIIGQGFGQGPQHSQSTAHMFAGVPGLTVAMPVTGNHYKRVLDKWDSPTVVFEHRRLYGSELTGWDHEPFSDVMLMGVSAAMLDCIEAKTILKKRDVTAELYSDVWVGKYGRSIPTLPGDSNNLVIVDVAPNSLGFQFTAMAHGHKNVTLVQPPSVPCPTSYALEQQWYPTPTDIANAALRLLGKPEIEQADTVDFTTGEAF